MKNHLSNRALRGLLSLSVLIAAVSIFIRYSEAVSPKKIEKATSAQPRNPAGHAAMKESAPPTVSAAAAFGESMPVRDLPRVAFDASNINIIPIDIEELREKRQAGKNVSELGAGEDGDEINKRNKEAIRVVDPNAVPSADGALSKDNKFSQLRRLSPEVLPTPSVNFAGLSIADTAGVGQSFLPPDTNGEVGPNHFVQTVNSAFRIWDKAGNPLTPTTRLGTLFSTLPGPCASTNDGDPVVLYDQLADRWLISEFCWSTAVPNHQLIAISKTADPTGAYFLYDFVMPNDKFNDYPKFGIWPDGYYMSDNQFNQAGNNFLGGGYFVFNRAKMLAGDATANYIYFDSCPSNSGCDIGGVLPSDLDGFTPPPAGAPNTFAYFTSTAFMDPSGDGLRLFDFHADFATPANSTFGERVGSPMPVAAFDPMVANITQPPPGGTTSILDTLSDRLMFRFAYRNFGGGKESLIVTHTVNVVAAGTDPAHAAVRYYQLDRTDPSAAYTIAEQQTFSPDASNRWMSSGAMNFQGDTAVGFSVSSSTIFPSVRYAAKLATDPAGSGLAQGEQTIIAGAGSQTSSSKRWGDYSDMTVDPADDCTFWYTQEYFVTSGTGQWRTRISKFAPRTCSVSPRGSIQGTATSCATGLPLDGVSVDAAGGYDRLSNSSGTFSMTIVPGAYDLVFTKFGYRATTTTGVSVANGGTANANACLAPIPLPSAPAISITTGNNVLDPNECNSLTIPIFNKGAATATGVTATLSSTTPGVAVSTASSPYPDINPNDSQSNSTPFRISTGASLTCFTSISLQLTINVAGSAPTIVNFTLPIGKAGDINYVFTSSNGNTISSTGTVVDGSQVDDALVPINLPAGFNASLYGVPITSITADTNGTLRINPTSGTTAYLNQALPSAGGGGAFGNLPTSTPVLTI